MVDARQGCVCPWSPSAHRSVAHALPFAQACHLEGVRKCAAMSRFQSSRLLPAPPPWRRLNRRSPSQQALPIRSPKASRVFRQTGARRIARAGRHPLPRRQRALLRPRPARAARTRVFPPSGNEALRAPQKVEWVGFARQRPHLPQCAAARERSIRWASRPRLRATQASGATGTRDSNEVCRGEILARLGVSLRGDWPGARLGQLRPNPRRSCHGCSAQFGAKFHPYHL